MDARLSGRRTGLLGCAIVSVGLLAGAASAHPMEGHGPIGGLLGRVLGAIFADEIARHEATHSHDHEYEDRVWCEEHQAWEPVYEEAPGEGEAEPVYGADGTEPDDEVARAESEVPIYDDTPETGIYDDTPETGVYDDTPEVAGVVVEPPDVLFDPGSSTLSVGAKSRLQRFADSVRPRHDLEVVLRGHTDGSPRESDAFTLSEQRAYVVRSFLVEEGVPWRRVRIVGLGDSRPAVSDDTASARQRNRRVEIVLREVESG